MQDIQIYMQQLGKQARAASAVLARANTNDKNQVLLLLADRINEQQDKLIKANQLDLEAGKAKGLDDAMLDRLALTPARIAAMTTGLRQVAELPDPIGEMTDFSFRPSGIQVGKMRVPLGVIGIIYESRPNVTIEAASLCLKSGNACILRGGSESIHSNKALAQLIDQALAEVGLPLAAVQVVETTDREAVGHLIQMPDYVDVIVPRGGKGLIARISNDAKVPVIKHLDGICHLYLDNEADLEAAAPVIINAKTHRYGVCNAMETLLVHQDWQDQLASMFVQLSDMGVELRLCPQLLAQYPSYHAAHEEDWSTEYLAPVLSIKQVADMDQAIAHINQYGSHHTDGILTQNYDKTRAFMQQVDSSSVVINASTRFADGFEYGLGAEIGISTDKIHARGPVGLHGLTSQKYLVFGQGHIRQ